jgi:CspA family cold shock protein
MWPEGVAMPIIGQVKWFNDAKGYGFLQAEGVSEDIFVHFSAIVMAGFRTLKEKTRVEFEVVSNDGRLMAATVHPQSDEVQVPMCDT